MEKTTNYDQFKKLGGNAPINIIHVNQLVQAIEKRNLLEARPILVNENMEVIDGQHRLEAAKILNIPIFFIVLQGTGSEDIGTLNSNQRNWKMEYYLTLFCDYRNKADYVKFRNWMETNELNFTQAISFFIDESNISQCRKNFKDGLFTFDDKYVQIAENYKIILDKIISSSKGVSRPWKQQSFVRAFLLFSLNPEIDMKRFLNQLDKYGFLMGTRPSKQLYLELFYEIYNYRRHIRVE